MSQVITNAFARYLRDCLTNERPVVLDEFVLANIPGLNPDKPISPDAALPPANQIVYRKAVDQRGNINNDAVAYTIVMDTTIGDFSFNAMYLINKATGVVGMIVHKGLETKLKTNEATGQTGNSLVKSMLMEYNRAAAVTATHVDASTWQIDYAARLRGMDDDLRLQALQFFGPATFYSDGFKLVNESGVYKVQPGMAYVGGLRAELNEVKKVTPGAKPVGLWLDIYRAGSLLDAWVNHFTLTLSVSDLVNYRDANGHQHHVAKVAIINANGSVTDVRRKRTIELTGDVTGKGILEDAQGVTIEVEIKDGSHRHQWGDLDQVPATASRWPRYDEVTNKPDLAAANHSHPGTLTNPIPLAKEDLNTIITPSVFRQESDANAAASQNYPEPKAGSLTVTVGAGVQQRYHVYNTSRVYTRAQYNTGAFTPWARDYNTLNKPTADDVGLGKLSNQAASVEATADTYALRDGSGDLQARTLRTNLADEQRMVGAVAFRVNYGNDSYLRYCTSQAAFRQWLNQAATGWEVGWRLGISDPNHAMTEYHIPGKTAVMTYLAADGAYRVASSNGQGGATFVRMTIDTGGNVTFAGAVNDSSGRCYSPGNQPHYTHNHKAAQGSADVVAGSYDAIGAYVFAALIPAGGKTSHGQRAAGAYLRPCSASEWGYAGYSLPGTWQCMGDIMGANDDERYDDRATLWIRVA
ncbi:phage tail-collar fiber domain-containing protein [Aeromonas hydrophila]|uniref:phage tail-collar fiber domain-containing protein n=1 Tax=Aeromonas hydrophila TaxID=644 RepID=UPI00236566C5|nr:phage tail protein [Aeromonas hydrophila]WDF90246.1 phage tail protein [Aeromonas hydrophila subsp. hydrophila]